VTATLLLVLLFAAALHAGWNALVKGADDREAAALAVAAGGGVLGALALPFLPAMAAEAIPFVVATALIHVAYYFLVARAYRGDLSVAYPLMRGLAPLLVTAIGAVLLGEVPGPLSLAGILLVSSGIIALAFEGLAAGRGGRPAVGAALVNAAVIAAYTLCDGVGVRVSGAPATYLAWLMLASALTNLGWTLLRPGRAAGRRVLAHARLGLVGGGMSAASYGLALWAMTVAPIGLVAAIRESSVLFAAAMGAVALDERFGARRWTAAAVVAAGLAAVKLGAAG
jgi:drug/metabolite transporter (DMT)-like permease